MLVQSWYRLVAALCLSCSGAGCADTHSSPLLSKASAASEAAREGTAPPVPSPSRVPLGERLAREANERPEVAVRPERLFEELARKDVELLRTRQAVAATLGASYCVTSLSAGGLGLAVCEFADEEGAERGEARSHELFDRLITGRTLIRNANTLLTLTGAQTKPTQAESSLAVEIFESLLPEQRAMP